MTNKVLHILFLTKWYPNVKDPQLGVFVEKHARAVSKFCKVSVLYLTHYSENKSQKFTVETKTEGNLYSVIVYYNKSTINNKILSSLQNIVRYYKAYRKGFTIIKNNSGKVDVFHSHVNLRPSVIGYLNRLFSGIPYIISEHWTGYFSGKYKSKGFIERFISSFVFKRANACTTVSLGLKKSMIFNNLNNRDFTVVPNVLDDLFPVDISRCNKKTIVLTVADLVDFNKNISGALEAISEVWKNNKDFEYHIIGGGPDEEKLKNYSNKLDLDDGCVTFLGRKDNNFVLDYISKCDFSIINSNIETFSVFTAESLALGKPVIVTKCGGPEDYVDEKTGIVIEKENKKQLVDAVASMLQNYKNYDPVLLNQSVINKFSEYVVGSKFYELYKKVISK